MQPIYAYLLSFQARSCPVRTGCRKPDNEEDVMFWNEKTETLKKRDLETIQLKRLKKTIAQVQNVSFYRNAFRQAGIIPGSIRTLDDIRRIPFTRKQDLRDGYPFGFFAVPLSKVVRIHTTSGTTGKPTVVGYTRKD